MARTIQLPTDKGLLEAFGILTADSLLPRDPLLDHPAPILCLSVTLVPCDRLSKEFMAHANKIMLEIKAIQLWRVHINLVHELAKFLAQAAAVIQRNRPVL